MHVHWLKSELQMTQKHSLLICDRSNVTPQLNSTPSQGMVVIAYFCHSPSNGQLNGRDLQKIITAGNALTAVIIFIVTQRTSAECQANSIIATRFYWGITPTYGKPFLSGAL